MLIGHASVMLSMPHHLHRRDDPLPQADGLPGRREVVEDGRVTIPEEA